MYVPRNRVPRLSDVTKPPAPKTTVEQRAALRKSIEADGVAARAAGDVVRSDRDLTQPIPPQPF